MQKGKRQEKGMKKAAAKPKRKAGRPRIEFDQAVADRICDALIEGKPLDDICVWKGMPTKKVTLRWLREVPSFQAQYGLARGMWVQSESTGMVKLADSALGKSHEEVQAIRLMLDTRKWLFGKHLPKVYGERLDVNATVDATVEHREVSHEDLARQIIFLDNERHHSMSIEEFAADQVLRLHWVAESIRNRSGPNGEMGTWRDHVGPYEDVAKGIDELAELVRERLTGQPRALPAPQSEPSTRAREPVATDERNPLDNVLKPADAATAAYEARMAQSAAAYERPAHIGSFSGEHGLRTSGSGFKVVTK